MYLANTLNGAQDIMAFSETTVCEKNILQL